MAPEDATMAGDGEHPTVGQPPKPCPKDEVMCPCEFCTKKRQKAKVEGTSLEDVSSPSLSDEGESEPEHVAREKRTQHGQLIALDSQMRMKVSLTTIEADALQEIMKKHCHEGEVELAIRLFGQPESRAATKKLWLKYMDVINFNYHAAEATSTIMVDFTLAKSLLLSSRALLPNKPDPGCAEACYCLPRTSLMPGGCHHRRINVGSTPLSSKKDPWHCSVRSMCLRCYKLLDLNLAYTVRL